MKKRAFIWGLVALAFILLFPFSASASIVDYVDLTPEQTLALYGSTLHGTYWNGSEYDSCDFTYCYTYSPDSIQRITFNGSSWSQNEKDYLSERTFLIYEMDADSATRDNIISSDTSRVTLNLVPSISVQGIAYFRQFVGFSFMTGGYKLLDAYNFVANGYSYSPTESIVNCKYSSHTDTERYPILFTLHLPYDSVGSPPVSDSGISGTLLDVPFNCFDCMGENLVDGIEQTFTLSSQQFFFNRIQSYGWQSSTLRDYHYFVYLTCPRLTDGYVLPDQPETTPNYSGQLDDINVSIGSTNTLLQQIIAKLDAIYAKMNSQGISISGTVEIGGPSITNIGVAIGNSVGAAIQNLFVPSQSDLMNFRLSMQTMCNSSLAPFFDVEQLRDNAIDTIMHAPVVDYVDLPLVDLTESGIPFALDASDFPGYEIVGNSVRVPLRLGSDWNFFYELVAWGFDVIATLAFINMVIMKLHALYTGEKVVEVDDN